MTSSSPAGPDPGPPSFEALLIPILGGAYGTARRLTRDDSEAEDLVQEAALLAYRGFKGFQPGTNFRAWFIRILTNAYVSRYRQRRRRGTEVELEDGPALHLYAETGAIGLHSKTDDPAGMLMDRLDGEAVTRALDELSDEFRAVATLYFVNDLTYEEIATSLGIPVGTVRSRLHRARRALQRSLWTVAAERGIIADLRRTP